MTKWTNKEKTQLIKLWKKGVITHEIAGKLNRSPASVRQKVYQLQRKGLISRRGANSKETAYGHPAKKAVGPFDLQSKDVDRLKAAFGESSHWGKDWDKYNKHLGTPKTMAQSSSKDESSVKITKTMAEITSFLLEKNDQYGDSALQPIRIFSSADKTEQLKVRIDDKLNRLMQGNASLESDEDVVKDLIGYLVLLLVNMRD